MNKALTIWPRRMTTGLDSRMAGDSFFEKLTRAPARALLLEYDGILAPFRAEREKALPYAQIPELLREVILSNTRVVVISGRKLSDLRALLPLSPAPELWGIYGWERLLADGTYQLNPINQDAMQALASVNAALSACHLQPLLEVKPGATAVHWRGAPKSTIQDIRSRVLSVWWDLEVSRWLSLSDFDGGIEFRARSISPAKTIQEILNEMDIGAAVAYLGVSATRNEDAYWVLKRRGLGVLVCEEFRPTAADFWLQPPEGVVQFLVHWVEVCARRYTSCVRG